MDDGDDYGVGISIPAPMDLWDKVCDATEPEELKIDSPTNSLIVIWKAHSLYHQFGNKDYITNCQQGVVMLDNLTDSFSKSIRPLIVFTLRFCKRNCIHQHMF